MTTVRTLILDIETHSADLMYTLAPEEFVRITGYKWAGAGRVLFSTDLDEVRGVIEDADMVIGHNIHSFDLPAIFGTDSLEPMIMADEGRIYDTITHAALVHTPPRMYTDRHGRRRHAITPSQSMAWFGLDEQAHQLGVAGKTQDLSALAHEYGDPSLSKAARIIDGYGKIPTGDPRYRDYLAGDVLASEAVAKALLARGPLDAYAMREQRIEARKARITGNGFRVDTGAARRRADELSSRKADLLARLEKDHGFPTQGVKPWVTTAGKAAVLSLLASHGITPDSRPDWTRTSTGAPSLGADVIRELTAGTPAEDLGMALAELQGQRTLAQLALESAHPDGFAHPSITMLQRSGRWSTTKPGLTVWSQRDESKRIDKAVFIPDAPDHVLLELDYSEADARIVAALSGDRKYALRFGDDREALAELTGDPGFRDLFKGSAGGHAINAVLAFGVDRVRQDPNGIRSIAKALGHAWNYGAGPHKLAATSGLPLKETTRFCGKLARAFPRLTRWQERVRREAERGYVTNPWGRRMRVDRDRAYTQAPALLGQSGTREIMCDSLLNMPYDLITTVKASIHDALVISVPRQEWETRKTQMIQIMTTEVSPPRGQAMNFPVSCGEPSANWADASH